MGRIVKLKLDIFFIILVLLIPCLEAEEITYCDKSRRYVVNVRDFVMSPAPAKIGQPAVFRIAASTSEAITGGKLVIDVSFLGVHVHKESHDLCDKVTCPVPVGRFELRHSQTLPPITPPGAYTLEMKLQDENDRELTCVRISFRIGLPFLSFC